MSPDRALSHDLTLEEFVRFRDYINEHAGIFLEEGKLDSLRISLLTRATRMRVGALQDYYRMLVSDDKEFRELLNLITINETSFFRFPQQFDALRDHVIPEVMENKQEKSRNLRVWSAGCSTGEEPYSISMLLTDMNIAASGWRPQVYGSDVSTQALAFAQAARYPSRAVTNLGEDTLRRHFDHTGDGYRVKPGVRGLVGLGFHNLIKEPYPLALMGDWDVIFCRNVTIYFQLESTRRVIANFYRCLNDGGYLFVGHSETLAGLSDDFQPKEVGGVFLYQKPRRAKEQWWLGSNPLLEPKKEQPKRPRVSTRGQLDRQTERRAATAARAERSAARTPSAGSPESLDPQSPEGLMVAARASSAAGDPRSALESLGRLLELRPADAEASMLSAYCHADLGEYDEALLECDKAIASNPLLPAARYVLGIIHQRRGDTGRAVSEFKKTIYIDADFALAHLNLGNMYKAQRAYDLACREYENALRALRKNPEGEWTAFMGGFKAELLVRTIERSLIECQRAAGIA